MNDVLTLAGEVTELRYALDTLYFLVMGALVLGRIPYGAWVKFVGPLLLKMMALAVVFLVLSIQLW